MPTKRYIELYIPEHLRPVQDEWGWVYWITSPARKGIKIGKTIHGLETRLHELGRALNSSIYCVGAFNTFLCNKVEWHTHKHFQTHKLGQEWFDLTPIQIEQIPAIVKRINDQKMEERRRILNA